MERALSKRTSIGILTRLRPGMVITLIIFWTILSGTVNWQHFLLGSIFSIFITFFWGDFLLDARDSFPVNRKSLPLLLIYMKDLMIEIVKANVEVVKIVLDPKLPISPCFVRYKICLHKTLSQVLLANSITLTPGTLSTYLEGDEIIVHALTREGAEAVADWRLQKELQEIEEASL